MKSSLTARFVAAAALASAAFGAASTAHANGNVHLSIGVQGVPVYATTGPFIRVQGHERRDGYRGPSHWDRDGDGIPNRYDRFYNPRWDVDGDGIPNRYDRFYNPPRHFDDGRHHGSDRWDDPRDRHHGR